MEDRRDDDGVRQSALEPSRHPPVLEAVIGGILRNGRDTATGTAPASRERGCPMIEVRLVSLRNETQGNEVPFPPLGKAVIVDFRPDKATR
jgi:hypothetical protein